MSVPTFNPPVNPTVGSSVKTTARFKTLNLGDGYSDRTEDGLNSKVETLSLKWDVLSLSEADEIESFFHGLTAGQSFWWTRPRRSTAQRWICADWTQAFGAGPVNEGLTLTFQEVFDLDD